MERNSCLLKGTSRQRSGKGAIRKRFPLQKPRREKTKKNQAYTRTLFSEIVFVDERYMYLLRVHMYLLRFRMYMYLLRFRKTFSKFYRRHYELISKYNVGLKTLLSEGLAEPEFYGDLVYKFKKLKGINDFSFQFRKIITRYRRIGYNLNVMRQSACLVFNPIMVDNYAAFFNCTPVGRASDSMMAPT